MRSVSRAVWLSKLEPGDIGYNLSKNPLASLQKLYHNKFGTGGEYASHSWIVTAPVELQRWGVNEPQIIEANGLFVTRGTIGKFIGGNKKVWIMRAVDARPTQILKMLAFAEGARHSRGHYAIGSLIQFGLHFLGIRKKISDEAGMFCQELTGMAAVQAGLPYLDKPPHQVPPSEALNWKLGSQSWGLKLYCNGKGDFYIA